MTDRVRQTPRTRLRRFRTRGDFSRETIDAILDEGLVCHMGFVVDDQPYVIPTAYGRVGDQVYLHGSAASRTLRTLSSGVQACVTVTLADGVVLAKRSFNHSINYRSVVLLGTATPVVDPDEKEIGLRSFAEQLVPGRWDDILWPTRNELRATTLLSMPIVEASAKVRTGPPGVEPAEADFDCWTGVIPLELHALDPVPAPDVRPGVPVPPYAKDYSRRRNGADR